MENNQLIRINKFLSEAGYCSRRKADQLIELKRVLINDEVPIMGTKVAPGDVVKVDGKIISKKEDDPVYIAFNKPIGIVCTTDTRVEKDNIIDYINYPSRIFPIGRLDKTSEGLIFLTNDGDIVNKILRAKNKHEKEYYVSVDKPINSDFIKKMSNGIPILNTVTRKCEVKFVKDLELKTGLTLMNRQNICVKEVSNSYVVPFSNLKQLVNNGNIDEDTLIYKSMIQLNNESPIVQISHSPFGGIVLS